MCKKNYTSRVGKLETFFHRLRRSPRLQVQCRVTMLARDLVRACAGRDRREIDEALSALTRAVTFCKTELKEDDRK